MSMIENLIIIGSGPAGLTAALYAARSNLKPLVIEGAKPGGQLMGTTYVENWPGVKSVLGPELMKNIREHTQQFGTRFLPEEITSVDFSVRPFMLRTHAQKELKTHAVIIATGATPRKLGCPGEETYWGKGVTTCAVCDGAFYPEKPVIIVGGGDTAMEDASFMTKFTKKITIIQLMDKLTASYAMQQKVVNNKDINIIYNSTITEIRGSNSHVKEVVVTDAKTKKSATLPAEGVFIAIGLTPKTELFKGQLELNDYGYILLKSHHAQTATSVKGVFAAGDVADAQYRQAITSAGTGCMAALDAQRYLESVI